MLIYKNWRDIIHNVIDIYCNYETLRQSGLVYRRPLTPSKIISVMKPRSMEAPFVVGGFASGISDRCIPRRANLTVATKADRSERAARYV